MRSKSNFMIKKKTFLALLVLLLSAIFIWQVTPGKANHQPIATNQFDFPLNYQGEGTTTDYELNHNLFGDTSCRSTATWEITLHENGRLNGSYLNTNPKAANNGACVSTYDRDHPSQGVNRIDFSGIHADGYFEITESNLYYDYTNTQFRGHDKNIQGYYDANHIYTSPVYRYESNTYENWTDVFEHEFDLPEVGGPRNSDESGQDPVFVDDSDGINPLVPIIGIGVVGAAGVAAVAGAVAVAVSRGRKGRKEKKDQKKKDPCVDDLNRLKEASAQARALFDGIQTLRSYLEVLETQYENLRQAAYWDASVDLGLLGASIFGAPLTIAITGKAVLEKTIAQAMFKSAETALGSALMKSVTNGMLEQGVSWESLATAYYGGAQDVVIQNVISESLTQRYQTQLIQRGVPSTLRNSLIKGFNKQVASHIASGVMQFISLGKIVHGAYTAAEKLEAIRGIMSKVRKSLFEMELLYEDALSEMRISRSVYNKCRKMWHS